ncbi:MAG: cupin domain-containing protein [Gaiellaceae bacterium]
MRHVAHWDDVEGHRREAGHIAGTWFDLGTAAGTMAAGLKRVQIDAGKWSAPAHVEGAEEEIFFVLEGSGVSWQDDGRGGVAYEVAEGDCLVHLAEAEAHTLCAGPDGLDVLAFGQRLPHGFTVLPRARVAWMSPAFVDVVPIGDDHPYKREAAVGEPEVGELMERPQTIVSLRDIEVVEREHGESRFLERDLGRAAGSMRTGMSEVTIPAAREGWPPHCHSAEEEIFVVLDGEGTLLLGDDEHRVRRGHTVGRPGGTRVPHSFRAGDGGMTYLAYGTREPNDIAYYPRSNKVSFRGVGVMARLEGLDYWDGEPGG